jgi:N-acetylglucosamine kinase-like BadF-type ATPase
MSVDGGGTKIYASLFDDSFRPIASGRGGGVNGNVVGSAVAEASMHECIVSCLQCFTQPIVIDRLVLAMCGNRNRFVEILREYADVRAVDQLSEGHMSLLAGLRRPTGALAQSGTGSFVLVRDAEGREHSLGGYGWILGDEGSGGSIGRQGISAALHACDGTGTQTSISDLLLDTWNLRHYRELVDAVYSAPHPVHKAASACPLVCQASLLGDEAAIGICRGAGASLARQMNALLTRHPARDITVGGSAWKGSPYMYDTFRRDILAVHPGVSITRPMFEPVMGGLFFEANRRGVHLDESLLTQQYGTFLIDYTTKEDIPC